MHNTDFNPLEFEGVRGEAGLHAFTMSPTKWIQGVNAIGIVAKAGRYGGTYAHSDIALEFASWISAEFKDVYDIAEEIKKQEKAGKEWFADTLPEAFEEAKELIEKTKE